MNQYWVSIQRKVDGLRVEVVFTVPDDGDSWTDGELTYDGRDEVKADVEAALDRYIENGEPEGMLPNNRSRSDWRTVVWVLVNMGLYADSEYIVDVLSSPGDHPPTRRRTPGRRFRVANVSD